MGQDQGDSGGPPPPDPGSGVCPHHQNVAPMAGPPVRQTTVKADGAPNSPAVLMEPSVEMWG